MLWFLTEATVTSMWSLMDLSAFSVGLSQEVKIQKFSDLWKSSLFFYIRSARAMAAKFEEVGSRWMNFWQTWAASKRNESAELGPCEMGRFLRPSSWKCNLSDFSRKNEKIQVFKNRLLTQILCYKIIQKRFLIFMTSVRAWFDTILENKQAYNFKIFDLGSKKVQNNKNDRKVLPSFKF